MRLPILKASKGFRSFLEELSEKKALKVVKREVSVEYEAASILGREPNKPMLFEKLKGFSAKVAGNVYSTRELVASYFGIEQSALLWVMRQAINNPEKTQEPSSRKNAPCYEVIEQNVDLPSQLPALRHTRGDGGRYVTASVFCVEDPEFGVNLSFHRMMLLPDKRNKVAIRVVPRDLFTYLKRAKGELEAAVTIGNGLGYLLAAATTVERGYDELGIANALEPQNLVYSHNGLPIPADSEYVLEGRIYETPAEKEGPFFDLTLTLDAVREQPVFEVKIVSHRLNPCYHALLPGYGEHRVLMGLPREPTIFNEVSKVVECLDVHLTPGGGSWLHGVVKIRKKQADDGIKAIHAAFRGHPSLKHVVIVDEDIDIRNLEEVEWAIATRFQADKNLVILKDAIGSSLDPSADRINRKTAKMGIDATIPFDRKKEEFKRWGFEPVKEEEC
ncbi:hypothetical protein B9Q02_05665 [Candidatus Marsarchaeota G1 archaeon BE_D]|uniref:Anhydromevalonate phosphate decarboxylase n=1 Tax=Candidatus Marsarchaeota G1 archaeon BE_D TaxID=1978156 RepID=A0A2R6AGU7_9ARCH|nr:MAG: hypothetical protein B9Q02_05665 [Candidatus Marsarchaeota G1 archaeon BE_D]